MITTQHLQEHYNAHFSTTTFYAKLSKTRSSPPIFSLSGAGYMYPK